MEKIKITKEQEKALKIFKGYGNDFESFVGRTSEYVSECKSLNDFTPEQFALLLCGWYEVEQPFKVGDWVYDKSNDAYGQITHVDKDSYSIKGSIFSIYMNYAKKHFEKVTEPWKIMLLELGRDKPEFKVGDKYTTNGGIQFTIYLENNDFEDAFHNFKSDQVKYFYPVESRIEVKHENN